jgi:hypothetical protein
MSRLLITCFCYGGYAKANQQVKTTKIGPREPSSESKRTAFVNLTIERRDAVPFCVLDPTIHNVASSLKRARMRDLSLLASKVHGHLWRQRRMSKQQFVKPAICNKYQTLLEECERALAKWSEHRSEVSHSRLVGKEAGDELLRLQAKYARAYTVLQNHALNCSFCQLIQDLKDKVPKIAQMLSWTAIPIFRQRASGDGLTLRP